MGKTQRIFLVCGMAVWVGARVLMAQPYGLNARPAVGPFLNGALPPIAPAESGGWIVVPAFPHLTFEDPTFLTHEPGTNRLYVGGRQGTVWFFTNDSNVVSKTEFLNITNRTQGWDDCGLLGMVFHPEFGQPGSTNRGHVFVQYQYTPVAPTNPPPGERLYGPTPSYTRLSRFTVPDGSLVADPDSELILVNQFDRHLWHDGSVMFFGPDGFLYFTIGDEGGADDFYDSAQKLNGGLFAGVFRIDVNCDPAKSHPIRRQPLAGGPPPSGWTNSFTANYWIPDDNPWVNPDGSVLEEFWALGVRSPHRMTYDAVTGLIWLGDVGQNEVEEVDLLEKGANYQWPYREGNINGAKPKPSPLIGTEQPPLFYYPHAEGNGCVIGGYVYRGTKLAPELSGKYIFGDNGSGRLWAMSHDGTNAPVVQYLGSMPPGVNYTQLSSFGQDENQELYMCQMGALGQIYKLARDPNPPPALPPPLLSLTGVFADTPNLVPSAALIPYGVNSPLWSDHAWKERWIAIPTNAQINFSPTNAWSFPTGTVFVKHFELPINDTNPAVRQRLETRLLVCDTNGSLYGFTYKWRADHSDADLLTNRLSEPVSITTGGGGTRTQVWTYPSPGDCLTCHTPSAGHVLGVNTRQLNGDFAYAATGVTDNQLRAWAHAGLLNPPPDAAGLTNLPALPNPTNTLSPIADRARSYLDANCAHCHRPNGVQANFDARFATPLAAQNLINGHLFDNLNIPAAKVIVPARLPQSVAYQRINTTGDIRMPPLGRAVVDPVAVAVFEEWINSLGLPAPWVPADLGFVAQDGSSSLSNGVFTIVASGDDIWGTADSFRFIYQPLNGDGEIVARVLGLTVSSPWAKAGVMMRESLEANARNCFMALSAQNGAVLTARTTPGDYSFASAAPADAPVWVRLTRQGDVLTGGLSTNGADWVQVGVVTNAFAGTNAFLGLAVTAHDNALTTTARVDSVVVVVPNTAPVLHTIQNQTAAEGAAFSVTATATDADFPTNSLTFGLIARPDGMTIDPTSGVITWTPTEAQGPSTNSVIVVVTDNGSLVLGATNIFEVVVREVNQAPTLSAQTNFTVAELTTVMVTNTAGDTDQPTNALTFGLIARPDGMTIDPASGVITWTPTEAQGPSTNSVIVVVTDNGSPVLGATNIFDVVVTEVNEKPILDMIPDQAVAEGAAFSVTATATDADLPTNTLTFELTARSDGMTIDPASGVITWTPGWANAPSTNLVTVVVRDNGTPPLGATNSFALVVTNNPPVLVAIALTDGEVMLSWNAVTGRTYRLEWNSDSTTVAGWTNSLGDFLSTNTPATVTDAVTNSPQRFYRVRLLP